MSDMRNIFDQHIKGDMKAYENIRKVVTGQGDFSELVAYWIFSYLKENYKMIALDIYKQQAFYLDPKAIQQVNFTANLDQAGHRLFFFIYEETKNTVLTFSQGSVKIL